MSRPVFIQCFSMVNALGASNAEIADRLRAGDVSGMRLSTAWRKADRPAYIGECDRALADLGEAAWASRCHRLALAALNPLAGSIRQQLAGIPAGRIAVIVGTSTSGIDETEQALLSASPGGIRAGYEYATQEFASPAQMIAHALGAKGPTYAISTACTSSTRAFVSARRLLLSGLVDAAIVAGCDSLCQTTVEGFTALEATSPSLTNPMSVNRRGINIGEGAGIFLVTRKEGPFALIGTGESCDAHHLSAPEPSGIGAEKALRAALDDACLRPADIGYVNLHGTGTVKNDEMEAVMMARVFQKETPCSSTKPMTGHTLGAAGATEVGLCCLALAEDFAPPHVWDGKHDAALPRLGLCHPGHRLNHRVAMTNNFAFGGDNVSLIIRRE